MAEMKSALTYNLTVTEREYKLIAKSLALLADSSETCWNCGEQATEGAFSGPRATADDRANAKALNLHLLDQQAADLREKLNVADRKRHQVKQG